MQCDLGVAGIDVLRVGVGGWVAGGFPRIRGCSSIVRSVEGGREGGYPKCSLSVTRGGGAGWDFIWQRGSDADRNL